MVGIQVGLLLVVPRLDVITSKQSGRGQVAGRCALACETVEKGWDSANFSASKKFLSKDNFVIKIA